MLFQGWHGLALRHPEYMLARDVAFLLSLFRESEEFLVSINWRKPPKWPRYGSENSQALARAVIQTCFNLLESFVSGLARAHVMTMTAMTQDAKTKLLDNKSPLKKRLLSVPKMITGSECGLREDRPPISIVFGPIKRRRDAFVHCEPGPEPSLRGYVKEAAFHDVAAEVVEEAVEATCLIIKTVWRSVYNVEGPRWLPDFRGGPNELGVMRLARP
jgi:hypothetical protein